MPSAAFGVSGAAVGATVLIAAVSVLVEGMGGLLGCIGCCGDSIAIGRARLRPLRPGPMAGSGQPDEYAQPVSGPAQLVRFAELDGRQVAWAAVGEGPPMVMGGWWMSHLELDWGNRRFRDFISALA